MPSIQSQRLVLFLVSTLCVFFPSTCLSSSLSDSVPALIRNAGRHTIDSTARQQKQKIALLRRCFPSGLTAHASPSKEYNRLRKVGFNTRGRTPLLIVLVRSTHDVSRVVHCAREAGLKVCARSGGHSYQPNSLCDGILIDLQKMRSVSVLSNTARVGAGATLGEVAVRLIGRSRWAAIGVCPSVGISGFLLGGGYSPYSKRLGLACDAIQSLTMVDRFGHISEISPKSNASLLWASCGGGGGQFGIVTQFVLTLSARVNRKANRYPNWKPAGIYDHVVNFRLSWDYDVAPFVLKKWISFHQYDGLVWARAEIYRQAYEPGLYIYGSCFDARNSSVCLQRLKRYFSPYLSFRIVHCVKARNVLEAHGSFGPHGDWGREPMKLKDPRKAFLNKRFTDQADGNKWVTQTSFLKQSAKKGMSVQRWKQLVYYCSTLPKSKSIPWVVCMLNLFQLPKKTRRKGAFAFRQASIMAEFIVGGGITPDKRRVYFWMKRFWKPFHLGTYVNYPEELQTPSTYPKDYWGKSLSRLVKLKRKYDPNNFFSSLQPIPV